MFQLYEDWRNLYRLQSRRYVDPPFDIDAYVDGDPSEDGRAEWEFATVYSLKGTKLFDMEADYVTEVYDSSVSSALNLFIEVGQPLNIVDFEELPRGWYAIGRPDFAHVIYQTMHGLRRALTKYDDVSVELVYEDAWADKHFNRHAKSLQARVFSTKRYASDVAEFFPHVIRI